MYYLVVFIDPNVSGIDNDRLLRPCNVEETTRQIPV